MLRRIELSPSHGMTAPFLPCEIQTKRYSNVSTPLYCMEMWEKKSLEERSLKVNAGGMALLKMSALYDISMAQVRFWYISFGSDQWMIKIDSSQSWFGSGGQIQPQTVLNIPGQSDIHFCEKKDFAKEVETQTLLKESRRKKGFDDVCHIPPWSSTLRWWGCMQNSTVMVYWPHILTSISALPERMT